MKILVTGGAGFIGGALIRHLIRATSHSVLNIDKLTYAGRTDSLVEVESSDRYQFAKMDICDPLGVKTAFQTFQPDWVIHLAAETHVDRSIDNPSAFVFTNVLGTFQMLEAGYRYWISLEPEKKSGFRFLHVSTDEVYGSLGDNGFFTESSRYQPNSPYSASKAGADHLARAWHHTYQFPVVISNCSNNYGPFQFPEKLIPLCIFKALRGEPIPVYGEGKNVRDWLYVEDHVRALVSVIERGSLGQVYNIGGNGEMTNLEVVKQICNILDEKFPKQESSYLDQIQFVADRPGHDFRYAMDISKIKSELGWVPLESFATGLEKTVEWYLSHLDWCSKAGERHYHGERLGNLNA